MKSEPYKQIYALASEDIAYVDVADILNTMSGEQLRRLLTEVTARLGYIERPDHTVKVDK